MSFRLIREILDIRSFYAVSRDYSMAVTFRTFFKFCNCIISRMNFFSVKFLYNWGGGGGKNWLNLLDENARDVDCLTKMPLRPLGTIQDVNLCIAPSLYHSQVDICRHFNAYSNANKCATLKLWFVVSAAARLALSTV